MPADLFPSSDPFLPWLPGETLFSLCSRHHKLWGHRLSGRTSELLFGRSRAGTQHDLPNSIHELVRRTAGQFGNAKGIALDRTLLRFYRPFMDQRDVVEAVREMGGPAVSHLKFRLGLLTSRFRANHPLKACAACMSADLHETGWVYWHLPHQYPGVWICPVHAQPLRLATIKSNGVERFLWHLPTLDATTAEWVSPNGSGLEPLRRFADLVCQVVERTDAAGWLQPEPLQRALRLRMEERNLVTPAGNIRLTKAADAFLAHCAGLRLAPELDSLARDTGEAALQVGRLCRPWRSGTHPLRLLVAIDWMFEGLSDYLAVSAEAEAAVARCGLHTEGGDTRLDKANRAGMKALVALLESGTSMSAAAKKVGITVVTAMAWAARAGIGSKRRPKVLTPDLRRRLLLDLQAGADKARAASTYGVSIETITRVLLTEVGLHAAWKAARFETARATARDTWMKLTADQPGVGTKLLRAFEPAAYAWLYRNDREWLRESFPTRTGLPAGQRRSPVRWDERDQALSAAVQRAVLLLAESRNGKGIRLWQLYQEVPELKAKLAQLHRLPLTQGVVARALGSRARRPGSLFRDDEGTGP